MAHKIFLSHNHKDKVLVEPVALRLKEIFGQDQVFYDSWSIQPGDSIIGKINQGLESPEFLFLFATQSSLASGMVKLEWQNALFAASKGKTRIVPIRVDGSEMPSILKQTVYIDMYTNGLEAAITMIVNVIQGNTSFTPQHQGFSNLAYSQLLNEDGSVEVTIRASHLFEPNPEFSFVLANAENDVKWGMKNDAPFMGSSGTCGTSPAVMMRPIGASLAPNLPLTFVFSKKAEAFINIIGVLHKKGENDFVPVPLAQSRTV
ncbi:toll/interleukin-1 receptor domain-containing protein [Verminephrobacter aporrectodeae]|uniref:toll/interleukin-1 receptor domain-containing protein n=1 Tax=Verminephrobacter aporrectodeae TaxID=1110389 RepID=UPI0022442466|nr:toll/interleukin-1 receptor domain-containing protein [Verminephrobacter aporrectodeae]MCW8175819.1 toll/interleukin-1 receptor domain-containing protein [Verminephrobacter aporrectodeae subsp. tuberculatae]MCW8198555.1 toll/interleukin-1 receptor domain-containing protein [Verminephrobacter aporrectodeae subsp. tuberculatae]MCW8203470.1 toll/interleukin-1 receptor domain-containing protein [Verminephrobacter aporrectodeae subsp. tuberculatae]